jgi:hypothetical protein
MGHSTHLWPRCGPGIMSMSVHLSDWYLQDLSLKIGYTPKIYITISTAKRMRIVCRSFMTFGVPYFQTNPFYLEMGWPGVYWERASRMRQRPSSTHGEESLKRLVIPDLVGIQTFLLGPSATWPVATLGMICHWDMHPHADTQFFMLSQMYHEW